MKTKTILFLSVLLFSLHTLAQTEVEVFNIENEAVQAFMADSTYLDDPTYKVTVINTYYNNSLYGDNLDCPRGKTISWTPTTTPTNIKEIRILLFEENEDADEIEPIIYTAANNETSFTIYNTYPNKLYTYEVEEETLGGTITLLTSGQFYTTGQVRMIKVAGARNVRDMGGWPTQYGDRIKYGKLFRSGNLDRTTKKGKYDFTQIVGVGAELDLRGESRLTSSALGPETDFIKIVTDSYTTGMREKNAFCKDLQWIIERLKENKSVDWHCAIGCDRCGTLSFLIGGLLGMKEIDLARDYELSTFSKFNRPRNKGSYQGIIHYIKKFGPADDLPQCFYNYWLECGVSQSELDWFIGEMLE